MRIFFTLNGGFDDEVDGEITVTRAEARGIAKLAMAGAAHVTIYHDIDNGGQYVEIPQLAADG